MKKTIIATALLGLASSAVLGTVVNAAPTNSTATTDAKIQFTPGLDDEGELVKPNPDSETPDKQEVIQITDGSKTKGPLRIQFVPNFNFGSHGSISADQAKEYANPLAYTTVSGPVSNADGKIAPFVQVSDFRGMSDDEFAANPWTLTVVGSEFKAAAAGGKAEHVLKGSTIALKESKLTTTIGDTVMAGKLAAGDLGTISTDGKNPLTVLKSNTDNTNGYQVSNVFDKTYTKTGKPADKITGVEFVKPAGITPQKDREYKASLTWTLSDAP